MKLFIKEKRITHLLLGALLLFVVAVFAFEGAGIVIAAILDGTPQEVCVGSCFRESTVQCPDGYVVTSLGGAAEANYKLDRASSFCRKVGTSGLEGSPTQVCTGSCFQESSVSCPNGYAVTGWGGALSSNAVFDRVSSFCRKVGATGLEGSPVEVCTGSCFRESTVLCPNGYAVTGWGGAVSSGPKLDRASSFCRKVSASPGTIIIKTTKDGVAWDSPVWSDTYIAPDGITYPASFDTDASGQQIFIGVPVGTYTVQSVTPPAGVTLQNINGSPLPYSQTLVAGGTITFTFNFISAPSTGTVNINATLNGVAWSGLLTIDTTLNGVLYPNVAITTPSVSLGVPTGTYILAYKSGGPGGATLSSITPSATQTLSANGTITFTFNFTSAPIVPTLVVTPPSASVQVGGTTVPPTFTAIYNNPADGLGPRPVTANSWTSSDITGTSVATINSSGLATGNAVGSANIRATYAGLTSLPATLTVTAPVPTLVVSPSLWNLAMGSIKNFEACFNPNGVPAPDCSGPLDENVTKIATWSSGDESKVTIISSGPNGGLAERVGFSPYSTVIRASYSGLVATADVYDTARLHVFPSPKNLTSGEHVQLFACFNPNGPQISPDCSVSPDKDVTRDTVTTSWKSGKPLIASVDSVGYVTAQTVVAVKGSKASVTASYLGFSDNSRITVFPAAAPPLDVSCSVTPPETITGNPVTWTAVASGGTGSYSYLWSGSSPLGGKTVNPVTVTYPTAGTKTGSVQVTSGSQTTPWRPCSTDVSIGTPPSPPLATLLVNGAATATIDKGQSATLTWTSTNGATRCDSPDFSTDGLPNNTSPGVQVSPSADTTYHIYCTNSGGVGPTASVSVTVISPKVSISAAPTCISGGGNTKISWSATPVPQMASCNVSGPGLSSSSLSGSQTVNITGKSTYTIACTTLAGSTITKSVIVDVSGCWSEF